jgi:hypothetical protein
MNSRRTCADGRLWFGGLLVVASGMLHATAQGTIETVLRTGTGQPLATAEAPVFLPPGAPLPVLRFRFGFATDEAFVPGQFFDSFTVSVLNTNTGALAVLATADASGFAWAPPTPGAVPIGEGDIVRQAIDFPSLQPVLANQTAYDVSFGLPSPFHGDSVNVIFDLFDNQNAVASFGFFSGLMAVPEPSVSVLLICGALLGACGFKCRRRRIS